MHVPLGRRRRASAIAAAIAVALSVTSAAATEPPPVPATAPETPLNKDFAKDLGKGRFIDEVEAHHRYPKVAYSPPDELVHPYAAATIGAPAAVEVVRGVEFANAPAAQALCQAIVDKLLAGWKGPRPAVTVRITALPAFQGRADDTGLMLVALGTFNANPENGALNVEELALLLGHELAHLLLGHHESGRAMTAIIKTLTTTADAYLVYAQVNNSHMVGNTLQVAGDKQAYRQGLIGGLATDTLISDLLNPGFTRTKELEADRLGIDLARRAGYNVTADTTATFIDHHREDDALLTNRIAALGIVLHALNAEAAQRAARAAGGFGSLVEKFERTAGDAAIGSALNYIAKRNKEHPNPAQRKAFAAKYIADNYPPVPRAPGARLPARDLSLAEVDEAPATAQLLGHVVEASKVGEGIVALASDTTGAGDKAAFDTMMKNAGLAAPAAAPAPVKAKGRKPPPPRPTPQGFIDPNAPLTWRMQGILLEANGDAAAARALWQRGLQFDYASLDMARRWARSLPPERRASEVPALVERFGQRIGTTDPLLDLTVLAAEARGDEAAAETAAARCVTYENGTLYPLCVASLGYDPLNKATPAHTEAGKAAFAGKSFEKNFQWMKNFTAIF